MKVAGISPKNSPKIMKQMGPAKMQPQPRHSMLSGRMRSSSPSGVTSPVPKIIMPTNVSTMPSRNGNIPGPMCMSEPRS